MAYKKRWPLAIISSIFLIFLISILVANNQNTINEIEKSIDSKEIVSINGEVIELEVVTSADKMYQGLSGRKSLCVDCGMLFKFSDSAPRSFVMRNMLIPLDIVFINEGRIVKIYKNLNPEGSNPTTLYESVFPARYVLELNANKTDSLGLNIGDALNIND
jgi:uncharacterized membrane protein (UPF0127 family)